MDTTKTPTETTITTDALAAHAHGATVTEYRDYQIVDRETFVTICRNAAVVQCADTPDDARKAIDALIAEREARKAANFKKMGRHEPKETDLI